jgi:hypothetical protein
LRLAEGTVAAAGGEKERDAARCVTGRVDDFCQEIAPVKRVIFLQKLMDLDEFRRWKAKVGGLRFHPAVEREIITMHHDGGAGVLIEFGEATDVVNMRVRADYGFDGKFVAAEKTEDAFDFVARIDDDAFQCAWIADDGAIALKHADGDLEIDHLGIGGVRHFVCGGQEAHAGKYIIGGLGHPLFSGQDKG